MAKSKKQTDALRNGHLMQGYGQRLRSTREAYMRHEPGVDHRAATWAKRIGVTPFIHSRWETGKQLPKLMHLYRLCAQFRISSEWIYRGILHPRMPPWLRASLLDSYPEAQDEGMFWDHENKVYEQNRHKSSAADDDTSSS
jgi:DNA-binding XRE family transcriptional regulator